MCAGDVPVWAPLPPVAAIQRSHAGAGSAGAVLLTAVKHLRRGPILSPLLRTVMSSQHNTNDIRLEIGQAVLSVRVYRGTWTDN